jgi:hypothetical protein
LKASSFFNFFQVQICIPSTMAPGQLAASTCIKPAFEVSVLPQDWCMPVCADWDLPVLSTEHTAMTTALDVIVQK